MQLNWTLFYLHAEIDRQADDALRCLAQHVKRCRRSMGQRFRQLNRSLNHDQATQ